mmetsp:Transcript_84744/g.197073  ORF Transcript_84744/g.197073 Transcript_84744/m.197073 type:complete len:116 (-) Transcript_84744:82-429(-)
MQHLEGAIAGFAWALLCSEASGQDNGSTTPAAALEANATFAPYQIDFPAERAGLQRRGILGDQMMLSLGGMVAITLVGIGGFYRYRQRRIVAPPPQVLGRLLDEQEMANGFGISG